MMWFSAAEASNAGVCDAEASNAGVYRSDDCEAVVSVGCICLFHSMRW